MGNASVLKKIWAFRKGSKLSKNKADGLQRDGEEGAALMLSEDEKLLVNATSPRVEHDEFDAQLTAGLDRKSSAPDVYLSGSRGATTWRGEVAIPFFVEKGVSYFNPQMVADEWHAELKNVQRLQKDTAAIVLCFISGETRAVASLVELAQDLQQNKRLVVVLEDVERGTIIGNEIVSEEQRVDLNRGRMFVRDFIRNNPSNAVLCSSLPLSLKFIHDRLMLHQEVALTRKEKSKKK